MINEKYTFKKFLEDQGHFAAHTIPYMIKWVNDCYHFLNRAMDELLNADEKKQFLHHLAKNHEDWQVKQSDNALRLYHYYLAKHAHGALEPFLPEAWIKIREKMIEALRLRHRSISTEKSYLVWLTQFAFFVNHRDPALLRAEELQTFLSHLAVERTVSAATQNQALNALVFLYRHVLGCDLSGQLESVRARVKKRLPVVLSRSEVQQILGHLSGVNRLMAMMIYGGGLRLMECIRLRVKDIDFERNMITVRSGKGDKDRFTLLPDLVKDDLIGHMDALRPLYEEDRLKKIEGVFLPNALSRKYPNAGKEYLWFWLFPSRSLSIDPRSSALRRHHLHPLTLQRAFKEALGKTAISKNASVHTLRHSFATHLIEKGTDVRSVQELLGHHNLQTTMIYTHVAQKNILGVKSPLDE